MLNFLRQAEELESQHQVVSPQQHLHVGRIGPEASGGNLGHGIGTFEFPQQKLLKSSVAIETLDGLWSELQIGNERSVVSVPLESEELLLDLFGFQSY